VSVCFQLVDPGLWTHIRQSSRVFAFSGRRRRMLEEL
jgi:hypothetical protein